MVKNTFVESTTKFKDELYFYVTSLYAFLQNHLIINNCVVGIDHHEYHEIPFVNKKFQSVP